MWHCEENKACHKAQGGSRAGRSTADVAATQELINDIDMRTRTNHASNANDAKACCDRMTTALTSLIDRFHGMPAEAVQVHAEALDRAKCCLKSLLGASDQCHTNTTKNPVHGNGQGAGDSPNQWGMTSSIAFDVHDETASKTKLTSPDRKQCVEIADSAFVDDTDGYVNDPTNAMSPQQLVNQLKKDMTTWDRLLWATGGSLQRRRVSAHRDARRKQCDCDN